VQDVEQNEGQRFMAMAQIACVPSTFEQLHCGLNRDIIKSTVIEQQPAEFYD
jgi:hypothetical protein